MKNIQNRSLRNEALNVKGASYKGDHEGVFAMDDGHADLLLGTPGWGNSARAPEAAPAASTFDPVAAMARNDDAEMEAVQAALENALIDVGRLETRLQTSEAARADLQTAAQSKDGEIADLREAVTALGADGRSKDVVILGLQAAAQPPAPTPPAPGTASTPGSEGPGTGPTGEEPGTGPDLEAMDKPQLLAAAEKWEVELTAAQKKLSADKLRPVLDKAIYRPNE